MHICTHSGRRMGKRSHIPLIAGPTQKSTVSFYRDYYRDIYYPGEDNTASVKKLSFCEGWQGRHFLGIVRKLGLLSEVDTVLELGCADGSSLIPFAKEGKRCIGYDLDKNCLLAGQQNGFDLRFGSIRDALNECGEQDLIVLSHVMEHFVNPIDETNDIIERIAPSKFFFVEVPGLFYDNIPLSHIQNAHVIQFFYKKYLEVFFEHLNLKVLYGNERCTFVLQKPANWKRNNNKGIYSKDLAPWVKRVEGFLLDNYLDRVYPRTRDVFKRGLSKIFK